MNTAIIVAAGSGKRFGDSLPKQFLPVDGKPLIIHTLERFQSADAIDAIVLVLPADSINDFNETLSKHPISKLTTVVGGGSTRSESVWNGLTVVRHEPPEVVAVHDGARPLVTVEEIAKCVAVAQETGAAILVAPVTDTIKQVSNGKVVATVDRNTLRRALTPQCFRYELLLRAYESMGDFPSRQPTKVISGANRRERFDRREGSALNIKITTKSDMLLFKSLTEKSNV